MRMPQIKMESQQARIAIRQHAAQMDIRQPEATMDMKQPKADLQISAKKARLNIDQSKAFAEANLKSTFKWNETYAAEGRQAASTGTARRASQGSQLIDIHKGGNTIASQAAQNGHPSDKMMGLKYMPSPFSVKMTYVPGKVNIQAQANKPQINVQQQKPHLNVQRGGVSVNMAQKAYLRMHVEES